MMYVRDLKESGELPEEFLAVLPDICESCGASLTISESLTGLSCANPWCIDKVVQRAKSLLQSLGVLGLGESNLYRFFEENGELNPLYVFAIGIEPVEGLSDNLTVKIAEQLSKKRDMLLYEYVMLANLPKVQSMGRTVLKGYNDLNKFYEDLLDGGVDFISDKLHTGRWASLQAWQVYDSFITYKDDLLNGLQWVNIVNRGDVKEVDICISDSVPPFKSKKEFMDTLNSKFGDKYHFINTGSVTKNIAVLICEGVKVTSKLSKAEKSGIPILRGVDFIAGLEDGSISF